MIAAFAPFGMAFICVQKCISTSVLRSFYRLEYGIAFNRAAIGGNIHRFYRQRVVDSLASLEPPDLAALAGLWLFPRRCSPIRRLLSVYTNRVLNHKDVVKALAKTPDATLDPIPTANDFFRDLPRYRAQVASIRHHIDNFAQFLGSYLGQYDAVFQVERVQAMQEKLSARLGRPFMLKNEQRSAHSLTFDTLSTEARPQILTITHPNFELLAPFYSSEISLRRQQRA